ncbi:MAG: histone deacetylase family protein [Candidatus Aenigmatarchaeota archaeon]
MDIVYSSECLEFGRPAHPESPERVKKAAEFLRDRGYSFVEPKKCKEEDLLLVHSKGHMRKVRERSFRDPDTPRYENIYRYARLSAGASIKASEIEGFSLMRPPGHHATENEVGGFCYFNNIAVAVEKLGKRTLIVDIDRHHGNGTQDIFEGNERVDYVSLHAGGYPGTGTESEKNYRNHVFRERTGDDEYLDVLEDMLDLEKKFDMVAVSAGFDGYHKDPLSSTLNLSTKGYGEIGKLLGRLNCPVFCVLEGGYHAKDLGENIHAFIQGIEG